MLTEEIPTDSHENASRYNKPEWLQLLNAPYDRWAEEYLQRLRVRFIISEDDARLFGVLLVGLVQELGTRKLACPRLIAVAGVSLYEFGRLYEKCIWREAFRQDTASFVLNQCDNMCPLLHAGLGFDRSDAFGTETREKVYDSA